MRLKRKTKNKPVHGKLFLAPRSFHERQSGDAFVVESVGNRFVRLRLKPGRHCTAVAGTEIMYDGMPFVIRSVQGRVVVLEGVE